ncbi:DsbA family protein [Sansalvadorimonas verongulae]|uniref:DsbA family protein n=1 Tax=Sansalvadorimonas verongulae TaxID=2172824 RepID=UPI0012BBB07F|nr:DsbA family protein [Sansalvadorimonas verongulae]MTI12610.1 DsbA family protein [Sansalvadorimonas verongulae]
MFKKIVATMVVALVSIVQAAWAESSQEQNVKIDAIVKMLKANPDVIDGLYSSLNTYLDQQKVFQELLSSHLAYMTSERHSFIGANGADVTLFNISDYSCPYCKRLDAELEKLVKAYPQVRVVNINVPVKEAASEVNSSSFALNVWQHDRTKFKEVNALLIAKPGVHNAASLAKIARKTGTEQYLKADKEINQQLSENFALFNRFGLRGTPGLIVGDQLIRGYIPYQQIEQLLKPQLLKKASGK